MFVCYLGYFEAPDEAAACEAAASEFLVPRGVAGSARRPAGRMTASHRSVNAADPGWVNLTRPGEIFNLGTDRSRAGLSWTLAEPDVPPWNAQADSPSRYVSA